MKEGNKKIIVAKTAGFCYGVERATDLAFEAAQNTGELISTLGPIIHNPQVVARLEKVGVLVRKDISQIQEEKVIIRSHGVPSHDLEELRRREIDIIDVTCPFVKKVQNHVKLLSQKGYPVVVVGNEKHPEVRSIVSYASGKTLVVQSAKELEKIDRSKKIGIVAQTTQSMETFTEVVSEALRRGSEIRVFNTICDATTVRQEESGQLADRVDCMIVVGGRNSSNTNRLAQICQRINPRTFHIETAEELEPSWFEEVKDVGVTAGASTPQWIISDVVERLCSLTGASREELQ